MISNRLSVLLPILAIFLMVIGCGQGGNDSSDLKQVNGDESPFTLVVEQIAGNVAESAGTAVRHEVKTLKGDVLKVTIIAEDAVEMTGAAVVLEYDDTRVTPTKALAGDFLGSDPIFFNTLEYTGEVPVAISQYKPFAPVNGKGVLAELYFEKGALNRDLFETGGQPPTASVDDLTVDFNAGTGEASLTWSEVNYGDYNQDSRVSGPDVLYLAAHIGEVATPGTPAFCCDSDGSGFADTQDLFAIAANYRNEVDGYHVFTSENYTMLGPWQLLDTVARPALTGDDPNWDSCLPIYGEDTGPHVYMPAFYPFWYKVSAYYIDDVTLEEFSGPNSNFATGQNAIVMQVGDLIEDDGYFFDYHNDFGNGDTIWVEVTAGEMEDTTAMSLNINFNNEYLDLDPESIILGDFFSSPNSTLFPPPEGVNDFDLVVWDGTGTAASGTGVVCYFAFDIDVDDEESNIYFGIDPEQGTLFTDSLGDDTQFSATGDDWAMWGAGTHPLHPPKPCFLFNDYFTSEYMLTGWEIGATGSDEDGNTGWYLDYNDYCTANASLHWYDPATEPDDAYGDRNDDWIMTPALDLTDYDPEDPEEMAIGISGQAMWELETGFPDPDYVEIQVATYPGYVDWETIHQFTGVNVPDPDDPEDPEDDPPCPGWTTLSISLFDYYGERIKIRLKAHSDFSNPEPMFGFAMENFGVGILGEGGGGGPSAKKIRLLLVQDFSYDSYYDWTPLVNSIEELGLTEVTEATDDGYVVLNNFNYSSSIYYYDEDLLDDFNAIIMFPSTYIYSYFLGNDTERELLLEWSEAETGRLCAINTPYYGLYPFGATYYSNYDPQWCEDFLGIGGNTAYQYGYAYPAPIAMDCDSGELYEDLDGASVIKGYYGGTFIDWYGWSIHDTDATVGLYKMSTSSYGTPQYMGWHKSDTGSHVIYDETTPSCLDQDDLDLRTQLWFEGTGFTLPGGSPVGWPDVCPAADVLPMPAGGEGFSWGGGGGEVPTGGGSAPSIVLVDATGYYNPYDRETGQHVQALLDAGFTEGGSGAGEFDVITLTGTTSPSGSDLEDYDIIWWFASNGYYYYQYYALSSTHRTAIDNAVIDGNCTGVMIEAGSIPTGLWIYDTAGNTWFHDNFGCEFLYPGYFYVFQGTYPMVPIDGEYLEGMGDVSRNMPSPYGYYGFGLDASWGATVTAEIFTTTYYNSYIDCCAIMDNEDWIAGYSALTIEDFVNDSDREEFMMLFVEECGFSRP